MQGDTWYEEFPLVTKEITLCNEQKYKKNPDITKQAPLGQNISRGQTQSLILVMVGVRDSWPEDAIC